MIVICKHQPNVASEFQSQWQSMSITRREIRSVLCRMHECASLLSFIVAVFGCLSIFPIMCSRRDNNFTSFLIRRMKLEWKKCKLYGTITGA